MQDRHGRDTPLGPTQEEVVAPLAAGEVSSDRDLPLNLDQVEWKYRDEFRPRFRPLPGARVPMKDAYSFDRDEPAMAASYEAMKAAYHRIFDRCGLSYAVVDAEAGQIGGGLSHEFMARAEVGEDLFVEASTATTSPIRRPLVPWRRGGAQATQAAHVVDTPETPTIERWRRCSTSTPPRR